MPEVSAHWGRLVAHRGRRKMLGASFQEYAIYWIGMVVITLGAVGAGIWQMIKHRRDD